MRHLSAEEAKAIRVPSGDHAGSTSLEVVLSLHEDLMPEVRSTRPVPSGFTRLTFLLSLSQG
jgi:hypothetical protein